MYLCPARRVRLPRRASAPLLSAAPPPALPGSTATDPRRPCLRRAPSPTALLLARPPRRQQVQVRPRRRVQQAPQPAATRCSPTSSRACSRRGRLAQAQERVLQVLREEGRRRLLREVCERASFEVRRRRLLRAAAQAQERRRTGSRWFSVQESCAATLSTRARVAQLRGACSNRAVDQEVKALAANARSCPTRSLLVRSSLSRWSLSSLLFRGRARNVESHACGLEMRSLASSSSNYRPSPIPTPAPPAAPLYRIPCGPAEPKPLDAAPPRPDRPGIGGK